MLWYEAMIDMCISPLNICPGKCQSGYGFLTLYLCFEGVLPNDMYNWCQKSYSVSLAKVLTPCLCFEGVLPTIMYNCCQKS